MREPKKTRDSDRTGGRSVWVGLQILCALVVVFFGRGALSSWFFLDAARARWARPNGNRGGLQECLKRLELVTTHCSLPLSLSPSLSGLSLAPLSPCLSLSPYSLGRRTLSPYANHARVCDAVPARAPAPTTPMPANRSLPLHLPPDSALTPLPRPLLRHPLYPRRRRDAATAIDAIYTTALQALLANVSDDHDASL